MPHSRHASVRRAAPRGRFDAVLFDLDGVLVDTEPWWNGVRIEFARAHGRSWGEGDQRAVMGSNSRQWAATMRDRLHLPGLHPRRDPGRGRGRHGRLATALDPPPAIDGALDAVRRIARLRPVALASSGHRDVIDAALDATGLRGVFGAIVSSDEVEHGKPAPDVYLLAALRLGVSAERCLVVEDSLNGVLAGKAAGMFVVLVPIDSVPPPPETRLIADLVIGRLADLDPDAIAFDPDAIARAPGSPAH